MEFIRPKRISLALDMAPLIDIVFQLLIFFMLSSSFLNPALKFDLPQAVKYDHDEPQQVVVSIDRAGKIFVNTVETSMDQFKLLLESKLANNSKKSIHLRGDKNMPYQFFVQAMDLARQAGARQINIVHEENK
jgi:biopolymer transport protein ExbD